MIQVSGNPVDVISAVVFFLFFLTIGMVLLLRPQLGVWLTAQWLQRYQRFHKLSDEQLERTPKLFFRSIAGDSIVEFTRDGAKHPESYPKAMLYVRLAGATIAGFMLVPACLVLLLISVFGVSFVSALPEQPLTLACVPVAISLVIHAGDPKKLSGLAWRSSETSARPPRIVVFRKIVDLRQPWSLSAKRPASNLCLRSLLAVLFVSTALAVSSCDMPSGSSVSDAQNAAWELVDAYMRAMANKDVPQAYALFSTRLRQVYSLSDVEGLLQGDNYGLFEGYESIEVDNVTVTSRFSTNPAIPKTMAQVKGAINYQGGVQGTFEANMELEGGQWRLSKVWIVVPPEKLQGSPEAMQPTTCSTTT